MDKNLTIKPGVPQGSILWSIIHEIVKETKIVSMTAAGLEPTTT